MSFLSKIFGSSIGTDFKSLMDQGAIIIDVRSPQEYDDGHIRGSKNIPLNLISQRADTIKSWGKPIITVCRSGARSGSAAKILKQAGVEAYNGGPWNRLQKKIS